MTAPATLDLKVLAKKIVNGGSGILLPWKPHGFGGDVNVTYTRDGLYDLTLAVLEQVDQLAREEEAAWWRQSAETLAAMQPSGVSKEKT